MLNSDTEARPGWLACLQFAASQEDDVGIVGARLVYPDGRIQFAGTVRNLGAPEWFDHRYRFKPEGWGPAGIAGPVLAVTGACMYITRAARERVGLFDERYPMAYEDVDLCLRSWQAGLRVLYFPAASLYHHESVTRGTDVGERERASQRLFWELWGDFFDARDVRTAEGKLRIVYVTEGTGVGGGHRDIFEHLNRLAERGHECALYTLGEEPDWFDLRVPVHSFEFYDELIDALAGLDAIKVATWWNTAAPVWYASVLHGIPVYFVQDIETSYYPDDESVRHAVIDSYRPEFRYMTISGWNRERLRELGLDAELIPPGIDLENFRVRPDVQRRADMVLALGRTNPLKNLPLTIDAWRALGERSELCLFGIEPELATDEGMRYISSPTDEEVGELLSAATVFVQTSTHEGFCLPALESMATGGAVVCTDAHGNRDFCVDGENCLMPAPDVESVSAALARLLADPELRARLGRAGIETAAEFAWERRIDALEAFLEGIAQPRQLELDAGGAAAADTAPTAPSRSRAPSPSRESPGREGRVRPGAALPGLPARPHARARRARERRARGARGHPALLGVRHRVRGAPRRDGAAARPAAVHRRRGRRPGALRRADARRGLGSRAGAKAAGHRARLLVRAGALDAPARHDDPVQARPEHPRRRLEHVLGREPLRRARPAGRSRWTSRRPSCRASTPRSTSSTTATRSSSGSSARWTRSRSRRAASTTSTAARSCTTTTPPACAAPSERSSACCARAGGC